MSYFNGNLQISVKFEYVNKKVIVIFFVNHFYNYYKCKFYTWYIEFFTLALLLLLSAFSSVMSNL